MNLQQPKKIEFEELKNIEINEILLNIYMKYLNEYKDLSNGIDMLKIKYLSLRNSIRVKNNTYNEIYSYFRNVSNDIDLKDLKNILKIQKI